MHIICIYISESNVSFVVVSLSRGTNLNSCCFFSILTGWGKHSKVVGDSALKRAVEALLTGMGAPFRLAKCNIGRFISSGPVVAAWLRESGTLKLLVLHDDRTHPENVSFGQISNLQMLPL